MELKDIDKLAEKHSKNQQELVTLVKNIEEQMDLVKKKHLKQLRTKVDQLNISNELLFIAVDENRSLFEKPKTHSLHGIKVGLQKGRGVMDWDDTGKLIKLIKKKYDDHYGVLIDLKETPNKTGLEKLPADELKALGITISNSGDRVLIKDAKKDIGRVVVALLDDIEELTSC